MKFLAGVISGFILALVIGAIIFLDLHREVITYPTEVSRPKEFKEMNGLLLPFSGYTVFLRDQVLVYLDLNKSEQPNVSEYQFWIFEHKDGKLNLERNATGVIDIRIGGNRLLEIDEGFELKFIDRHLINWNSEDKFFFSEQLPNGF
ncbi:MAG: hypothetical protein AB3N10_19665 [Allomuricauda sp.]